MVKVESGLFNRLSGTLEKSRTTFQTRKTGIVAEKKPIPPKDARGRRECVRWIYRYLCDKWNTLSEQEKQQYDETAEKHNITLFNAYLKEELTPRLWKCKLAKMDGQVLYLAMVEGEGNVAKDFSGYNNNATLVNVQWATGRYGHAIKFTGDGTYAYVTDKPKLNPDYITIFAWVRLTAPLSEQGTYASVVYKYYTATTPYKGFYLEMRSSDNRTIFAIRDQNNNMRAVYFQDLPADMNWHFVAGTYDGNKQTLYLDELSTSITWTGTISKSTTTLLIGANDLKAEIALVGILNKGLTSEEIAKIYELTKPYFE